MSFVLSARPTMQTAISSIAAGITDFVRDVQDSSANWIVSWNLVVVDSIGEIIDELCRDFSLEDPFLFRSLHGIYWNKPE